jgi:cell division septation protein DedD
MVMIWFNSSRKQPGRRSRSHAHRRKALPILMASLLLASVPLEADPLILRAQQREKAEDAEGAARLYAAWLQNNSGAPGSARVFSSYFRLENDYLALRDASLKFLVTARHMTGAGDQFTAIARLFELGGMTEEARNAYLCAWEEGAPDTTLVSAFLLSLEMHDTDAMSKSLTRLKTKGGAMETLLGILAAINAGDAGASQAALLSLADSSGDRNISLKALWTMFALARASDDTKAQADARGRLSTGYPGAPETALASSPQMPRVILYPSPEVFSASETANAAPAEPQAAQAARLSVQAGSFQVKENADDLSAELSKRGFLPVQKIETIQGKEHYRVLAGTGLDMDQARALISKLLQAGFSGILVTEK